MRLLLAAILLSTLLAGCSSVPLRPAPVVPSAALPVGAAAPAASAPAAAAPVAATPPGYYRVKPGDTLRSIARGVGHSWQDLARWNQLSNPNLLDVGELLRVVPPGTPGVPASPAPARTASAGSPVAQSFALGAAPAAAPASAAQPRGHASSPPSARASARPRQHVASAPQRALPASPAVVSHVGPLHWSWPAQGRIVRGFNGTTSKGVDIAGKAGEAVRAAAAGKVVYAGNELRGFGNLIIIKHDTEYISVYAHNEKLLVKDGQIVRRGQTIALMGASDAARVELHFEIRLRGKPIDPEQVLPRR